jgi:uncharacterized protein YdhG (YjbR/CyaY superfamily)
MKSNVIPNPDVDMYISGFPEEVQLILNDLRAAIRNAAPEAEEVISYQMPAYRYYGILVYFAAYRNHIGFYPGAEGIEAFKKELSGYKGAKGSVQFPPDKPLPLELISQIVEFRVIRNKEKTLEKANRKPRRKG